MTHQTKQHESSKKQFFYQRDRLISEVEGNASRSVVCADHHLIAKLRREGELSTLVWLATDNKRSVLTSGSRRGWRGEIAYTPYGFHIPEVWQAGIGFNGVMKESHTSHYFLGAGYRLYNCVLMRFQSPDSWSPFGQGGLNSYAFVKGDPVNHIDPDGHMPKRVATARRLSQPNRIAPPKDLTVPGAALGQRRSSAPLLAKEGRSISSSEASKSSSAASLSASSSGSSVFSPSPIDVPRGGGWTYSKTGAKFKSSGLNDIEQQKFDTFQNAIHHFGLSPANAALLAGKADFKLLDKNTALYQIRLSLSERVTFTAQDKRVEIRQVGGHT